MRIAINCRSILLHNRTGIGRYTYNLIKQLGQIDHQNQYILHAPKGLFDFKRHLPAFPYPNFKRYIDFLNLGTGDEDVYHLPSPAAFPKGRHKKIVVTIHDLIYKAYPQGHTQETIALTEKYMREIVAGADHIICTSDNTRRDLHRYFDYPQEQSTAILNGVDHGMFFPLADKREAKELLARINVEEGFILFVGTIEPRKNVHALIEAIACLKSEGRLKTKLVLVGMGGWMTQKIMPMIFEKNLVKDVIFTGFLTDAELNMLYNSCGVFTFPSFYEGFGFPIVEAFAAGAAVITSNTSSCAEIASNAAITVDPSDYKAIASAIGNVLEDRNLREQLRIKSKERAEAFSFKQMAQRTLDLYQKL